jgi:hypothetical protein
MKIKDDMAKGFLFNGKEYRAHARKRAKTDADESSPYINLELELQNHEEDLEPIVSGWCS